MATGDPTFADVIRAILQVRKQTPDLAWMLDVPDVGNLLIKRAAGQIDDQEFQYQLYRTKWWRKTSDSQRQWRTMVSIDPAKAQRQRSQMTARIRQMMGELGVQVPGGRDRYQQGKGATRYDPRGGNPAARIADLALYNGWDENQITNYLLSFATWGQEGQSPAGGVAITQTQIRKLEEQYGVLRQDRNRFQLAKAILSGRQTIEGLEEKLRQQAQVRYGGNETIAGVLDRGGTVNEFFDPYRQLISQELEIPSDTISLNDKKWQQILSKKDGGVTRPMTMDEALTYVRSQAEWSKTRGAKQMEAGMARNLLNTFGRSS